MEQLGTREEVEMRPGLLVAPLVLGLVLAGSTRARADYDKTHWGMSLAEVKRRYPGGSLAKAQNGYAQYWVIGEVAGRSPAVIGFEFQHGALASVNIQFPKTGSVVRVGPTLTMQGTLGPIYDVATPDQVELDCKAIRMLLTERYGSPFKVEEREHVVSWAGNKGDGIFLDCAGGTASLMYVPSKTFLRQRNGGL